MKFKYLIIASALYGAWCVSMQGAKPVPTTQALSRQLWDMTLDGGAGLANEKVSDYIKGKRAYQYLSFSYHTGEDSSVIIKGIINECRKKIDDIKKDEYSQKTAFVKANEELLKQQGASPQDPKELSEAQKTFSLELGAYRTYLTTRINSETQYIETHNPFAKDYDATSERKDNHIKVQEILGEIEEYHKDLTQINTIIQKNAQEIPQTIKSLLAAGANPTAEFSWPRKSSIQNAMDRKDLVMLAAIFDGDYAWCKKINPSYLIQACKSKDLDLIRFFLEKGADPNANDPLSSLLRQDADDTMLNCLQALLMEGANPMFSEEVIFNRMRENPPGSRIESQLDSINTFEKLTDTLQNKVTQEAMKADQILADPLYKIVLALLTAKIIYTANIKPFSGRAGTILTQKFKNYLDTAGRYVTFDKNFDPINNPYPCVKDGVKDQNPVRLLVTNDNSGCLAVLLAAKRADNGQSLVSLVTAQSELKNAKASCKELLEHFIKYETTLAEHSDIMPFKEEELKNIQELCGKLKPDAGKDAQQALTNVIADRLHALLFYEVSKLTKEDKKTEGLRRGDSKMVKKYLECVDKLMSVDPTRTLVDQPFQYGDKKTVNGKTPIELAIGNKHTYCLKQMQSFLKKVRPAAK